MGILGKVLRAMGVQSKADVTPELKAQAEQQIKDAKKQRQPYPGPFLDGNAATGMEIAYVDLRVGGTGAVVKLYKPYPPNSVINEVLAGNAPEYVLQDALDTGKFKPSDALLAAEKAYKAWKA